MGRKVKRGKGLVVFNGALEFDARNSKAFEILLIYRGERQRRFPRPLLEIRVNCLSKFYLVLSKYMLFKKKLF